MISRVLGSRLTWIVAPVLTWALVSGVIYKAGHPLSAKEVRILKQVNIIQSVNSHDALLSPDFFSWSHSSRYGSVIGPLFDSLVFAEMGEIEPVEFENMRSKFTDYLKVFTNKHLTYFSRFTNIVSEFIVPLAQRHDEVELLKMLNLVKDVEGLNALIRGKFDGVLTTVDAALEYGLSNDNLTKIDGVLLSAADSLKTEMPTLAFETFLNAQNRTYLNWSHSFIYGGGQRLKQMAERNQASESEPLVSDPYLQWTEGPTVLRSIERGLLLSKEKWMNLLEPAIQAQVPDTNLALAAGLFLNTPERIELNLEEMHRLATRVEIRRAAVAAAKLMAAENRLPRSPSELEQFGYVPAEAFDKSGAQKEFEMRDLFAIKKSMYKPIGETILSVYVPQKPDISDWLDLPDDLVWDRLEGVVTSDTIVWTAEVSVKTTSTESIGNTQQGLVLGLWLNNVGKRPGLRVESRECYRLDSGSSVTLDNDVLKGYWKYSEPGQTQRDTMENLAAPGPLGARVRFVTAKEWGKVGSTASGKVAVDPVVLRPRP